MDGIWLTRYSHFVYSGGQRKRACVFFAWIDNLVGIKLRSMSHWPPFSLRTWPAQDLSGQMEGGGWVHCLQSILENAGRPVEVSIWTHPLSSCQEVGKVCVMEGEQAHRNQEKEACLAAWSSDQGDLDWQDTSHRARRSWVIGFLILLPWISDLISPNFGLFIFNWHWPATFC